MLIPSNMKPSVALELHCAEIRAIVLANNFMNPRVFGSVVRGEDTEDSDLDLLFDVAPPEKATLFDLVRVKAQLEKLLGVKVDVGIARVLRDHRREEILCEAVPV